LRFDEGCDEMNRAFSKALADCISQMERGASVGDCLKGHPLHANELGPHLETWQTMAQRSPVQPSAAAFDHGRQAVLEALESAPATFGPLAAVRLAPRWATVSAAVAAFLILISGAAGASAALGGPDPAGEVLSGVGVSSDSDGAHGGIGQSSASDRGLECANPNAFEGSANSDDKAQNADDAHTKKSCSKGADEGATVNQSGDGCEDANNGHGNDADHDDADNPGQGEGNNGASDQASEGSCTAGQEGEDANNGHGNDADHDDTSNPGEGQGNHGTNDGSNAGGDGNANPNEPQGQGGGLNKN
jgi:hypothetical protein